MKAVLKMPVADGAVLEFDVKFNMHKGTLKATVDGQNLYAGEGDTIKASVEDLIYKISNFTASELEPPKPSIAPRAG